MHDDTERRARAADISEHRGDPPPFHTELLAALDTGVGECFVAIGDDDTTLVFALVTVDMVWAHLAWFLSLPDDERASSARYQLTLFIIRALIERRLEYLFADSALTLTPGLRYFQERLGFEPMNVRVWEGRSALTPGGQLPEAVAVR